MMTREPGQSVESARALEVWWRTTQATSDARMTVARLQRELREARKILKAAEAVEAQASRDYEATPYAEAVDA